MHTGFESPLVLQAPAKLNLFLKILGKRSDGFHEIETLMQTLDLHDTLRFLPSSSGKISLEIEHVSPHQAAREVLPTDHRNLIVRAALLLKERTNCLEGVDILLRKRIPSQAGLGGGSSDAATTLLALNQLWKLQLSPQELIQMAAELGSDIPFFVSRQSLAVGYGRGEQLHTVPGKPISYVLVKPDSGLSTAEVYANCKVSPFPHSSKELLNALHGSDLSRVKYHLHNSLQEPAEQLNEDVQTVLSAMQQQNFLATMMSGSGTACFGICRNRREANFAAAKLQGLSVGTVIVAHSRV
ncbi:4-(cytidine 5'-diphospho)-2-C-methyl-D-erythritol kinase [Rubinisphaera sp.]|uniref:4-(cytidine 5'-diphospho)-2-C-methyl-D-erythritol kinase n=1 Tax=Rubinisphaera sp. TaxID=2024857 RepID=UPI000C0FDEDC|nr:4-(cytidine 5'-diphospho)-2-C-methyl-D-erythritol kinase [Rubinisphaera sp.]MBV09789.1 4-(cytidine 5'-diphospho)-2-C-methyl-D-erythritol kinase [Rubinisphaera sp.]HCS55005.1 4-(cytidine 5'-diphospho)-2-C-methyl-D-erythritol kinase [Planctomycetaceae bacterium]|tara:strand:- start:13253 stop:14146 length:894 start_codon:yes stop_codon:yes gene_type:complete